MEKEEIKMVGKKGGMRSHEKRVVGISGVESIIGREKR